MVEKQKIHLNVPKDLLRKLDQFIDGRRFKNRTELLLYIIDVYTDTSKWVGMGGQSKKEDNSGRIITDK